MKRRTFCEPRKLFGRLLVPLVLLAVLPTPATAYPPPEKIERASVASGGTEGNGWSMQPALSADGRYVAFDSDASNLAPGDTNDAKDVFLRDRETGTTEQVSMASDGAQSNGHSHNPAISADARYVAFWSDASNLAPGDTNSKSDIFVRDRETGTTERVSMASDGAQSDGHSHNPAISADGRYVAFWSFASNLVPGDTNGCEEGGLCSDVFVHDRAAGKTERVSVASDGTEGNEFSVEAAISADGRYVAFYSAASNLVPGDVNEANDVFVRDRETGTTERVSMTSDGAQSNGHSFESAISADGRYVAFWSSASNLVPGDANEVNDVFVRDRAAGTTELVSVTSDGAASEIDSYFPAISADGRYVAFWSFASNLVPGDTNRKDDIFVRDRAAGTTERVSVASGGAQSNGHSFEPAISADGRYVGFWSYASNLVPGDTNEQGDIFVQERGFALGMVGEISVSKVAGGVDVSGRARFPAAAVTKATDPEDDGGVAARGLGAELTGAAFIYRPEQEDLLLRLDLSSLPSDPAGAGLPGVLYGMELLVGDTRYEVRALRAAATATTLQAPYVALYRCDPDCTEHTPLTGSFGIWPEQVLVSVPLSAVGAAEGTELTDLRAFTAVGEAARGSLHALDEIALSSSTIPASRVELGLAPASTTKGEVAMTVEADLFAGEFAGTVPTPGLSPEGYRVWARACLGESCGPVASAPATVTADPDPVVPEVPVMWLLPLAGAAIVGVAMRRNGRAA